MTWYEVADWSPGQAHQASDDLCMTAVERQTLIERNAGRTAELKRLSLGSRNIVRCHVSSYCGCEGAIALKSNSRKPRSILNHLGRESASTPPSSLQWSMKTPNT
jgi:hypothetical protein